MKTTVEIQDALLEQARQVAAEQDSTLRELIEDGLRRILADRRRPVRFRLRRASFKGKGLQQSVDEGTWKGIRDLIYEGRGS